MRRRRRRRRRDRAPLSRLTGEQAERVMDYCRTGLLDKYRDMELPEESYFEQPRIWRLSVFDHEGQVTR
jgi:hypothetical protein